MSYICLCGAQPGYPHAEDCPRPLYHATAEQETTWYSVRAACRVAWAAFVEAEHPAWEAYQAIEGPAKKAYMAARATGEAHPVGEAYDAAETAASKAYLTATRQARHTYLAAVDAARTPALYGFHAEAMARFEAAWARARR